MTESPAAKAERPGVIGRPVLVFLTTFPLALALDHWLPLPAPIPESGFFHWTSAVVGIGVMLAALAFVSLGIRNFSRAGTPVPTNQPARTLVVTGIHRRSRNPIYVGFLLFCAAAGILIRSPWLLILAPLLAAYFRYAVIAREEAYLEQRFGKAYRDYKAGVRRWI